MTPDGEFTLSPLTTDILGDSTLPKVTSVNGKTGDVVLNASDVGAETSAGAAAKVSAHNTSTTAHQDLFNLKLNKADEHIKAGIDTGVLDAGQNSGFAGTHYSVLTGLYDGQGVHDAATVGQLGILSQTVGLKANRKRLFTDFVKFYTDEAMTVEIRYHEVLTLTQNKNNVVSVYDGTNEYQYGFYTSESGVQVLGFTTLLKGTAGIIASIVTIQSDGQVKDYDKAFELKENKVITINSSVTNDNYPSAKAVYNYGQNLDLTRFNSSAIATTIGTTGSDSKVPTEKAVRTAITGIVDDKLDKDTSTTTETTVYAKKVDGTQANLTLSQIREGGGAFIQYVDGSSTLPSTRQNGASLQDEDYIKPKSSATFPFTIGGVTFANKNQKAVYSGGTWSIKIKSVSHTGELEVSDPANESISGTKTTQEDINKENKQEITSKVPNTRKIGSHALTADVTVDNLANDLKNTNVELKNKTINADNNTILNIDTSEFKAGAIVQTIRPQATAETDKLVSEKAVADALGSSALINKLDKVETITALPQVYTKAANGVQRMTDIPALVTYDTTSIIRNTAGELAVGFITGANLKPVDPSYEGYGYVVDTDGVFRLQPAGGGGTGSVAVDNITIKKDPASGKIYAKTITENYVERAIATPEYLKLYFKDGETITYQPTVATPMEYKGSCLQADLPTGSQKNGDYWKLEDTTPPYEGQCAIWNGTSLSWDYSSSSITVDTVMSGASTNPVQNKVIKKYIDEDIDEKTIVTGADGKKKTNIGGYILDAPADIIDSSVEASGATSYKFPNPTLQTISHDDNNYLRLSVDGTEKFHDVANWRMDASGNPSTFVTFGTESYMFYVDGNDMYIEDAMGGVIPDGTYHLEVSTTDFVTVSYLDARAIGPQAITAEKYADNSISYSKINGDSISVYLPETGGSSSKIPNEAAVVAAISHPDYKTINKNGADGTIQTNIGGYVLDDHPSLLESTTVLDADRSTDLVLAEPLTETVTSGQTVYISSRSPLGDFYSSYTIETDEAGKLYIDTLSVLGGNLYIDDLEVTLKIVGGVALKKGIYKIFIGSTDWADIQKIDGRVLPDSSSVAIDGKTIIKGSDNKLKTSIGGWVRENTIDIENNKVFTIDGTGAVEKAYECTIQDYGEQVTGQRYVKVTDPNGFIIYEGAGLFDGTYEQKWFNVASKTSSISNVGWWRSSSRRKCYWVIKFTAQAKAGDYKLSVSSQPFASVEKIDQRVVPDNCVQSVGFSNGKIWTGTRAEYDAITTKDSNTFYHVTNDTSTVDIVKQVYDTIYPVNSIVFGLQAPGAPSGVTWTDVSASYDGRYFKVDKTNAAGTSQGAQLPNIKGGYDAGKSMWYLTDSASSVGDAGGAFKLTNSTAGLSDSGAQSRVWTNFGFNANRSSSIYQDGGTVRPLTTTIKVWKRTA